MTGLPSGSCGGLAIVSRLLTTMLAVVKYVAMPPKCRTKGDGNEKLARPDVGLARDLHGAWKKQCTYGDIIHEQ